MSVQRLVDSLARDSTSRLVAALARRLGAGRIAIAEDAVQHALMQALSSWPFKGVPDKPAAWLAVVARNRALDLLRHEARNVALDDEAFAVEPQQPASDGHFDRELSDDELALLFAVCHPALSPEMRVTFALKTVCGLTVPQIASGLLSEPTAIAQRLVRARKQLEAAGVAIEAPPPEALPERAESVRTALYLMFNEGYSASSGEALVQPEFCVEAVRLSRALAQHPVTAGPASDALAALLALTAARLPTRVGPDGVAQLLEDQPRSQWDRGLIALGFAHLERSAAGERADGLASARRDRLAACRRAQHRGDRLAAHRRCLRPAARGRSVAGRRAGARRCHRARRWSGGRPGSTTAARWQPLRPRRARSVPGGTRPGRRSPAAFRERARPCPHDTRAAADAEAPGRAFDLSHENWASARNGQAAAALFAVQPVFGGVRRCSPISPLGPAWSS